MLIIEFMEKITDIVNRKLTDKEIDELAGSDLGRGVAPKIDVPLVRLNGKTGVFLKLKPGEEPIELGDRIKIIPLKARRIYVGFVADRQKRITRYFTNEHNYWRDKISLFAVFPDSEKPEFIDAGTGKELKQKYPMLKMNQIIYCLLDDELVKLTIRGAGMRNWFEFRDSLEDSAWKYLLEIGRVQEESSLGSYYVMVFTINRELEKKEREKATEKIIEISQKIKEIDDYYKEREVFEEEIIPEEIIPEKEETEEEKYIDEEGFPIFGPKQTELKTEKENQEK